MCVEIDDSHGSGRGQTLCDVRGQRLGSVDQLAWTVRVVLEADRPLADQLVRRLTESEPGDSPGDETGMV